MSTSDYANSCWIDIHDPSPTIQKVKAPAVGIGVLELLRHDVHQFASALLWHF